MKPAPLPVKVLLLLPLVLAIVFPAGCSKTSSDAAPAVAAVAAVPAIIGKVVSHGTGTPQPIEGVNVAVQGMQFQAKTNDKGEYSIGYVPGHVVLVITKDRYLSAMVNYDLAQGSQVPAAPVELTKFPEDADLSSSIQRILGDSQVRMAGKVSDAVSVDRITVTNLRQESPTKLRASFAASYTAKADINSQSWFAGSFTGFCNFPKTTVPQGATLTGNFDLMFEVSPEGTWSVPMPLHSL